MSDVFLVGVIYVAGIFVSAFVMGAFTPEEDQFERMPLTLLWPAFAFAFAVYAPVWLATAAGGYARRIFSPTPSSGQEE